VILIPAGKIETLLLMVISNYLESKKVTEEKIKCFDLQRGNKIPAIIDQGSNCVSLTNTNKNKVVKLNFIFVYTKERKNKTIVSVFIKNMSWSSNFIFFFNTVFRTEEQKAQCCL
jgi:hypothetical protein